LRYHAGDFLGAATYARRVIAMDSLSLTGTPPLCRACDAYALLVSVYADADSLQAARRIAREWTIRQPRSPHSWTNLAIAMGRLGQDSAIVALRVASRLAPGGEYIYLVAQVPILADDFAETERVMRGQLQIDPRNSRLLWYLGISLRNQGRLTELSQ